MSPSVQKQENLSLLDQRAPSPFLVRKRKRADRELVFWRSLLRRGVLLFFALFFGVPLLWLVLAPTKTNNDLLFSFPLLFGSWHNFTVAWGHLASYNNGEVFAWCLNSVIYAVGSLVLALGVTLPAGYALATIQFRGRSLLLMTTLVVMLLPTGATVLPLFLEMNAVHLLNTAWSVILPSAFYPFGVYLTYIYFSTSISSDLLDAARVDGGTQWQLFTRVALPLATPIISLVAFFSFVGSWNNYFLPFLMLSDDHLYNLPVGLAVLFENAPGVHPSFLSELQLFGPEEALAALIVVLPVLVLFFFSQRFLVAGIVEGSVKG